MLPAKTPRDPVRRVPGAVSRPCLLKIDVSLDLLPEMVPAEKPPWFFSSEAGYGGPIKTEKPPWFF
ncbi:MAG: hypothetical protein K8R36_15145, partial [Planctomycetales bacterium]|nr:hypothetical protein [Planctomycetales bacterium]